MRGLQSSWVILAEGFFQKLNGTNLASDIRQSFIELCFSLNVYCVVGHFVKYSLHQIDCFTLKQIKRNRVFKPSQRAICICYSQIYVKIFFDQLFLLLLCIFQFKKTEIRYSTDNGNSWNDVTAATPDDGSFVWTTPEEASSEYLIKISDIDGYPADSSDAVFMVATSPFIDISSPNGGESWPVGSIQQIGWTSVGTSGSVQIEHSANNGADWNEIIDFIYNSGCFDHPAFGHM